MRIEWVETEDLQPGEQPGVDFYTLDETDPSGTARCILASVEGLDWVADRPEVVRVRIRPADAELDIVVINEAKGAIGAYIRNPGMMRKGRNPSDSVLASIRR